MITQLELKKQLNYDPETGIFTWVVSCNNQIKTGSMAGTINNRNYICIQINKKIYLAHRLAWVYVYGEWPKVIDHINGIKTDNRIENLRNVTQKENGQNRKEHRNGHLLGTTYDKALKQWKACIIINKKRIHLGLYQTQENAHNAYLNKLKEIL